MNTVLFHHHIHSRRHHYWYYVGQNAVCTYELGALALTARQEKLQAAEQKWVTQICRVKRNGRIKMKRTELTEEIGMNTFLRRKIVGSGMDKAHTTTGCRKKPGTQAGLNKSSE